MDFIWYWLAKFLAQPSIARWLIKRAKRTPYSSIVKNGLVYMDRFWLFNPYRSIDGQQECSKFKWWPWNIRIHHIRLADVDRHMHDHPWNARTVILNGYYMEKRLVKHSEIDDIQCYWRHVGDTARIGYGEYHAIEIVPDDGVWTLFISGPYQGTWGFWVDGIKIKWRTYLGLE